MSTIAPVIVTCVRSDTRSEYDPDRGASICEFCDTIMRRAHARFCRRCVCPAHEAQFNREVVIPETDSGRTR
jgi:hypothetical protein